MFIGHFGVGFGAKRFAPGISLGILFIAAQFLDLLWPSLLLLDLEHVVISPGITKSTPLDFTDYPISHSLLTVAGWGALLGFLTWLVSKNKGYAIVIFACVVSHWFLDLIVHRPDLPVIPGSDEKVGIGLWNYPALAGFVEGVIFFSGVSYYNSTTIAKNNRGKYGFWSLVVLLVLIHIGNMAGPPPPSVKAIAWVGQSQWLLVLLGAWIDKNRQPVNLQPIFDNE